MDEYIRAGEAEKATPIQYAVDEIISALCSGHGSMYAVIKEVMKNVRASISAAYGNPRQA